MYKIKGAGLAKLRKSLAELVSLTELATMSNDERLHMEKEIQMADIEMKKADLELNNLNKMQDELKKDFGATEIKSFKLDKNEFLVNGQQQSKEMHKKYAKKYLKNNSSICSNCTIDASWFYSFFGRNYMAG